MGWRAGDKTAKPVYIRDRETGKLLLDDSNNPIIDSDFAKVLDEFRRSAVADLYPWILEGRVRQEGVQARTTSLKKIVSRSNMILDPKRYCAKYLALRNELLARGHFTIGDVLEEVEREKFVPTDSAVYRYVEIEDVRRGSYDFKELRGWQLPGRARLRADVRDVFIAHIWSCAGKWFVVPDGVDEKALVVTNGCTRFRIRPEGEAMLSDLVAGLCSELFSVQLRALATGSDGLAQVAPDDILGVVIPSVQCGEKRRKLSALAADLLGGSVNFSHAVRSAVSPEWPQPPERKNHCALV